MAVLALSALTQACGQASDDGTAVAADGRVGGAGTAPGGVPAGPGVGGAGSVVAGVASTVVVGAARTEITVPADARASAAPVAGGQTVPSASSASSAPSAPSARGPEAPPSSALAAAEVTTPTLPRTAQVGLPPPGSEPRNQLDQPIRLDESGSLACARGEFALEAIDAGDAALARNEVAEVARWGAPSANAAVSTAAVELAAVFSDAPSRARVEAFLAVCTANGHVL